MQCQGATAITNLSWMDGAKSKTVTTVPAEALAKAEQLTFVRIIGRFIGFVSRLED